MDSTGLPKPDLSRRRRLRDDSEGEASKECCFSLINRSPEPLRIKLSYLDTAAPPQGMESLALLAAGPYPCGETRFGGAPIGQNWVAGCVNSTATAVH